MSPVAVVTAAPDLGQDLPATYNMGDRVFAMRRGEACVGREGEWCPPHGCGPRESLYVEGLLRILAQDRSIGRVETGKELKGVMDKRS